MGDEADGHFGDGVNCFRRFDQPGNWFTSRNKCLYGNGDLATLDNTTTAGLNEVLGKLGYVSDGTKRKYWVGLTKLWWQWVPGERHFQLKNPPADVVDLLSDNKEVKIIAKPAILL